MQSLKELIENTERPVDLGDPSPAHALLRIAYAIEQSTSEADLVADSMRTLAVDINSIAQAIQSGLDGIEQALREGLGQT